jgi:hypothetical protein
VLFLVENAYKFPCLIFTCQCMSDDPSSTLNPSTVLCIELNCQSNGLTGAGAGAWGGTLAENVPGTSPIHSKPPELKATWLAPEFISDM